jgi:hypothetical protein
VPARPIKNRPAQHKNTSVTGTRIKRSFRFFIALIFKTLTTDGRLNDR